MHLQYVASTAIFSLRMLFAPKLVATNKFLWSYANTVLPDNNNDNKHKYSCEGTRVGLENIRWTVSAFNDSKNLWTKFSSPRHRRMTEWQQTNREKNTQTHTHTLDPNTKTSGNCNRRQCARKETKKKSFLFRFWICHKMCLRRVKFTNIFRAQNNAAPLKIAVPHAVCGDGCSAFAF